MMASDSVNFKARWSEIWNSRVSLYPFMFVIILSKQAPEAGRVTHENERLTLNISIVDRNSLVSLQSSETLTLKSPAIIKLVFSKLHFNNIAFSFSIKMSTFAKGFVLGL
ncbi:hypothetical protein WA026_004668 [Henosepilachna vigintioctopunctata]|uniref:Uncharacterized protein n=1 Tax=Henosepilachna vigintioctopunctata TaxID=420089 RepID=A0AAW1TQR6_9CUCU